MPIDEVFDIFREEAREHLRALETSFLDLETADSVEPRSEVIDCAFRHAHSLKSDAKVVGLPRLKQAAQELEDILDELRENPDAVNREAIDRGLAQFDRVREAYESWEDPESNGIPESTGAPHTSAPDSTDATAAVSGKTSVAWPPESPTAAVTATGNEFVDTMQPLPAEPPPPVPYRAPGEESFTVRVPSDRLDCMLNLAGEVRISQRSGASLCDHLTSLREQLEQFRQQSAIADSDGNENPVQVLDNLLDHVRRIDGELRNWRAREELLVEDLENNIRRARLLPLAMLTDSLRRVVRDLSNSLARPITYEADAGTIMLDKAVIEALKAPLTHMVRNAADHGIESSEDRQAAGKTDEGRISISAARRGQMVRITLSDNGRGVDFNRIRHQIVQNGECEEQEAARLTERELTAYLFRAGFSTAPTGEFSGRGVGLDVARDTVRRLQGQLELLSSSPAGTTFSITVPVSVSTVRVLTVTAGGQHYGIPCSSIVRTARTGHDQLRELQGQLILPVNGRSLRWVHLAELLGRKPPPATSGHVWSYLEIAGEGRELAVAVDDLEDESEVLLKPLGYPLTGLTGVVGATIRADGSVQIVLDLTDRSFSRVGGDHARAAASPGSAARILVVDDSPTTRAVLRNVFTAAGYSVTTATDGIDALERLGLLAIDVVISDVEMPRLNGFDLTRRIKTTFGLPVILVTGREEEEHRREGLAAGADAYVVKSTFEDLGLLEIIEQFV